MCAIAKIVMKPKYYTTEKFIKKLWFKPKYYTTENFIKKIWFKCLYDNFYAVIRIKVKSCFTK